MNSNTSCREIEENVGVSKTKTHVILKKHKYFPYKRKIIHHLRDGDAERRITFCNWYLHQCREQWDFGRQVIWSDESHISSAGIFNRHNNRFWANDNQFVTVTRQQQGRFGFNISCFILGGRLVYHIFDGNLNSEGYIQILDTCLPELIDNIPLARLRKIHFQQDGAPCHNSANVRNYLNRQFQNQWIGNSGPINWPARSPDLSILDFFLWGFLKNKIYQRPRQNYNELVEATRQAFEQLRRRPVYLIRAIDSISRRCELCILRNGEQFEQYLK